MQPRSLGRAGPSVSAIGLGCMFYGKIDESEFEQSVRAAFDVGIDFFDTADVYDGGSSERLLGKSLAEGRGRAFVATKFGIRGRRSDGTLIVDGSPEYAQAACTASLRRLGVGVIDLYYLHRFDPAVPIEETFGAMQRLVEKGWVRHLGLSEVGPETLRRAHAVHPVTALQSEYSLWSRGVEAGVLPACRELGVALVAYSPLGRGFLAGAVKSSEQLPERDLRLTLGERFVPAAIAHNATWLARLEAFASPRGLSLAQLALAWLLHRGSDVFPIPGTRRAERVRENALAAQAALSPAELAEVESIVLDTGIAGDRYPRNMLEQLGR